MGVLVREAARSMRVLAMDAHELNDILRARVFELTAQTGQRNVPLHMATAMNELITAGHRISTAMLAATPMRRAIPGNEGRIVKRVEVLHTDHGLAYMGIELEPLD